ncbi:MAG: rhomboid family intramembrane serine protease [Chitinophagales bacterium]
MIFPIGDDQVRGGHHPLFSYSFIAMNVLIFLYQASLPIPDLEAFVMEYGARPIEIMNGQDNFTLLTSMFLHGGWMHLIGNMLFLWVFADNIEASIGSGKFLIFYILGGVAAALAHVYFNTGSGIPTIGASGAIAAVLGAYIVMFPRSRVKVLVFFFSSFRIAAIFFLGFWIVQQVISGMGALDPALGDSAGVAWWAHIGGFAFGVLAGFFFKGTTPKVELARYD